VRTLEAQNPPPKMASISTSSPIMPRSRRQTRSKAAEESCSSKPTQSATAAVLIGFIFFLYAVGFISCVLTLPEANNRLLLLRMDEGAGNMLNLSKYRRLPTKNNAIKSDKSEINSENEYGYGYADSPDLVEAGSEDYGENESGSEDLRLKSNSESRSESQDVDGEQSEEMENIEEDDEDDQSTDIDEKKWLDDDKEQRDEEDAELVETPMKKVISLSQTSTVPKSIWPVTTRNEDGKWEDIVHPGDSSIKMTVPSFWSLPIHDQKLMPRAKAMQVGTCITPDSSGNKQRGDKCNQDDRTIFVAIASYRDWQCRFTLESIFSRAKYPERVRVGVVDQIVDGDDQCDVPIKSCDDDPSQALCKYSDFVDALQIDAQLSVGPVFARHLGHRLYRGEYYAMQSDAHVTYTQDWDVDIIKQMEATGDEMTVLTSYLTDVQGSINTKTGNSLRKTRPIMCNTEYETNGQGTYLRHLSQPELKAAIVGMPQLEPYWAAGFSFSRGHFVVNVPYDLYQPMIFQGEEMSIAVRGFTIGYDFFSPEQSVCFHHYAKGKNTASRGKVNHFWENAPKFAGVGKAAMLRLLGIVHMNPEIDTKKWLHSEEDRYGIGNVRTPEKFYTVIGVNVQAKTTIPNLCGFVSSGIMHKSFMKHLRHDGMGIDYEDITQSFLSYL